MDNQDLPQSQLAVDRAIKVMYTGLAVALVATVVEPNGGCLFGFAAILTSAACAARAFYVLVREDRRTATVAHLVKARYDGSRARRRLVNQLCSTLVTLAAATVPAFMATQLADLGAFNGHAAPALLFTFIPLFILAAVKFQGGEP